MLRLLKLWNRTSSIQVRLLRLCMTHKSVPPQRNSSPKYYCSLYSSPFHHLTFFLLLICWPIHNIWYLVHSINGRPYIDLRYCLNGKIGKIWSEIYESTASKTDFWYNQNLTFHFSFYAHVRNNFGIHPIFDLLLNYSRFLAERHDQHWLVVEYSHARALLTRLIGCWW